MVQKKSDQRKRILFLPCYRDERMLEGICEFAYKANWILDSFYYHSGLLPQSWDGDGIISLLHVPEANPELTAFVRNHRNIPVVGMSMNDPSINMPRVLQDNPAIGRIGAEHLASLGIRNMGFLLTHTLNHFHQERYEGFRDACQDLGLRCTLIEVPDDFATKNDSAEWLTRHINMDDRPFGIMTAADYLSQWVIRGCASANLSIPDDVAIVGVDNCREICELAPIALSSIDNNALRQGYEAARLLDCILNDQPPPDDPIRIPAGSLYVRASSSILATRHPHVATALKYIAEHYTDPDLSTKQITDQVPMSDRRLHDAFLAHVGRSVYQEITHRRIQHAIQLIQETDLKLWDISESVGFNSPEAMSRLFRRQLGHPPSAYRTPGSRT